ncbi:MAG: hypothetical protein AB1571_03515 [Nanoarchaeota archaeon]
MEYKLIWKLSGAVVGSIGLFLTAFGYIVLGAFLIGAGGILMAIGQ